jgi:hypothetical protein
VRIEALRIASAAAAEAGQGPERTAIADLVAEMRLCHKAKVYDNGLNYKGFVHSRTNGAMDAALICDL